MEPIDDAGTQDSIFPGHTESPSNGGKIWGREPVMVVAIVEAVIALVVSLGLALSAAVVGSIMAVTTAILGFVARSQVTPVYKLEEEEERPTIQQ